MKEYTSIEKILEDGIFQYSDILIFWGKRGKGKSSLAGFFMSEFMKPKFSRGDVRRSQAMLDRLQPAGYRLHAPEDHLVFCDTFFESRGYLQKRQRAYQTSLISFGLPNDNHVTDILVPCGKYFFDEVQDVLDSHGAAPATFVSKAMELSRHLQLFICLIAQRPMRIHKDIRELATFFEIVGMKNKYTKHGRLNSTTWTCNIIYDNARLEKYMDSGEMKYVDKQVKFTFKGNVFDCYDSNFFFPMFFRGFENSDYWLERTQKTEFTKESFKNFYRNRIIDIPDSYKGKKKKAEKQKEEKTKKEKKDDGKGAEGT